MTRISVKLKGIAVGGRLFPVGSFRAEIESAEMKPAKSSGKPMIVVTFVSRHDGVTARQFSNYSLQTQSLFALKRLLAATGEWEPEELETDENLEFDTDDLVGLTLGIVVGPTTNQHGKPSTEIVAEIPEDEATGKAAEATAVTALATGDQPNTQEDFSKLF